MEPLGVVKGASVQIVADEWCNTLEDVRDFVEAGAAHMIQVKTPDLGGINNTLEAIIYAKERGMGAYLGAPVMKRTNPPGSVSMLPWPPARTRCWPNPGWVLMRE